MKTAEFKKYVAEFTTSVESATTIKELKDIESLYKDYDVSMFTVKQINALYAIIDAKLAAITAADLEKAEKTDSEYPDVLRVELCNPEHFASIKGEQAMLCCGFGTNRNVGMIKRGNDGKYYAKLSPIADYNYDGEIHESRDARFIRSFISTINYYAQTKKGGKQTMKETKSTAAQTAEATAPVEVLKGEVIDTKTEKEVNAAIGRISAKVEKIGKGYLDIVGDVARLRALKAWKITGHKSMYELCADKFGMSRGTVANLEAIFNRYGDKETYKLTDEAEGLSVREMLANIKTEKAAELEDKGGESADGEGNGNGGKSGKGGKIETLTNISIQLSADWSLDEILEELKAQLTEQNAVYPEGATLTLTITK